MSKTSEFLQQISHEMGRKGVIDEEVMVEAQKKMFATLNINPQQLISGQIFLRKTGQEPPDDSIPDRELVMVIGLLAIPRSIPVKTEHQYPVFGGNSGHLTLHCFSNVAVDRTKQAQGHTADGLLTQPIWKC